MRALSIGANLTANTLTTLYTVPTGYYARVVLLRAANASSSTKHITFDWTDTSESVTYSLVYQTAINSKTTQDWGGVSYFVMEEGDILKATSESASTYAVAVTIEQIGLTRA
jgi:hypothetical protein